tara:strand:- start:585 stop:1037 length:453 start_codon:yes stop_codon:yes gene_type:complete
MLAMAAAALDRAPGFVPALSDNGASHKTNCSRSLDGAYLPSHNDAHAGPLDGVGGPDAIRSLGSYYYVHDWLDASGHVTHCEVRLMRHTPKLHLPIVLSEPTEVYDHGAEFKFTREGRMLTTAAKVERPLFMSTVKLGWLKLRPVTDPVR